MSAISRRASARSRATYGRPRPVSHRSATATVYPFAGLIPLSGKASSRPSEAAS
jgi:hypothetical protein